MANKTYLELTFNDVLFRRFNVTTTPENIMYGFIDNLPKGVVSELVTTQRDLPTGKINDLTNKSNENN